jgi:chromate transporter
MNADGRAANSVMLYATFSSSTMTSIMPHRASLIELALVFLRLGATAFGGPAAHIAMMRAEFVDRRKWMTEAEFVDLVGMSNIIPGPSSTEVAIFVGFRRAGWLGLFIAGSLFILPAALIVTAIAAAYVRFGHLPQASGILYGIKPVIIAVVAQAVWMLARTAIKGPVGAGVGLICFAACFFGCPPLAVLFGAGVVMGLRGWLSQPHRTVKPLIGLAAIVGGLLAIPAALTLIEPVRQPGPVRLTSLFVVFAKVGSVVFGSGYVLLAFLQGDLVSRLHWLTPAELLDAVSVGQFTPGPVFTTATFIGYLVAGPKGAAVATIGIFLPAFVFVALAGPLVRRIREYAAGGAFLDGVNAAALALMANVTWQLGRAALGDWVALGLAVVSAVLLFRVRINSAWLVLGGAVVGFLVHR